MRIAVVAPPSVPVPPPAYGGTEMVVDGLCRGLVALGHDVLLCTTGDSTCPVERSWLLPTSCGLTGWTAPVELAHIVAAYDAAARWRADIVHDHTILGPVYAGHRPGVVAVTTNHGPFDPYTTAVYRAVAPQVPVIAISWSQASKAVGVPIAAVIHHGIDPARFPFGPGDGGYAVFLGRMSPDKAPHTAARLAREAGRPLRIAAKMREPAERRYFEDEVRPLLGGDVQFVGEVAGRAKSDLLAGATCLVNPIAWPEPFGVVMIESLSSGTPVVAAPRGAAPEIVDHGRTGFLCGDDERFVAALGAADRLDRRACRASVEARFTVDRMVREHVAVYERIVSAEEPPRAELTRTVARDCA